MGQVEVLDYLKKHDSATGHEIAEGTDKSYKCTMIALSILFRHCEVKRERDMTTTHLRYIWMLRE